jgi:hypothetical protein
VDTPMSGDDEIRAKLVEAQEMLEALQSGNLHMVVRSKVGQRQRYTTCAARSLNINQFLINAVPPRP